MSSLGSVPTAVLTSTGNIIIHSKCSTVLRGFVAMAKGLHTEGEDEHDQRLVEVDTLDEARELGGRSYYCMCTRMIGAMPAIAVLILQYLEDRAITDERAAEILAIYNEASGV